MASAKQVNREIFDLLKGFDIAWGRATAEFTVWLNDQMLNTKGRTTLQIVREGWLLFNIGEIVGSKTTTIVVESAVIKILSIDPKAEINLKIVESDLLNKPFASDGITLKSRISRADTRMIRLTATDADVNFNLASDMAKNEKELRGLIAQSGNVEAKLLRREVREMTSDIRKMGFTKDYTKQLKLLEKRIAPFSEENFITSETKKAYEAFIKGVKGQNIKAFEAALETTIKKKTRYIARRIARTEQARAQTDSLMRMRANDTDVIGWTYHLDSSHKIEDLCDVFAKADFGLGVGVYPKNQAPSIPVHANCRCYFTEVIEGDIDGIEDFDFVEGGNKFMRGLDTKTQNLVSGSVERGKEFRKGGDWNKSVLEWGKPSKVVSIKSRLSKEAVQSVFI